MRHEVSEATLRDAEFTLLRYLSFTVRTASLQAHESLYRQLQKPLDFLAPETSKAHFSDAALFMLFQAYLDDRVRETPQPLLVAACLLAAAKVLGLKLVYSRNKTAKKILECLKSSASPAELQRISEAMLNQFNRNDTRIAPEHGALMQEYSRIRAMQPVLPPQSEW